jgi:hypothetical protein
VIGGGHIGKGVLIGKLGLREKREGRVEMMMIGNLLDQGMIGLLLHQIVSTGANIDLYLLNQQLIPELVTRCLVISTPSNDFLCHKCDSNENELKLEISD